jgi:hypothetical protein
MSKEKKSMSKKKKWVLGLLGGLVCLVLIAYVLLGVLVSKSVSSTPSGAAIEMMQKENGYQRF